MLTQNSTKGSNQEETMTLMKKFLSKKPFHLTLLLFLGLSISLSACSNTNKVKPKPQYKTIQTFNEHPVETGTVVSVRTIQIQQQTANSYGNIGVSASSGGFSGIYGSIDLATVGRIFNKKPNTRTVQEVIVKKSNGQTVAITQIPQETFLQGDAVKILSRNGESQVIH